MSCLRMEIIKIRQGVGFFGVTNKKTYWGARGRSFFSSLGSPRSVTQFYEVLLARSFIFLRIFKLNLKDLACYSYMYVLFFFSKTDLCSTDRHSHIRAEIRFVLHWLRTSSEPPKKNSFVDFIKKVHLCNFFSIICWFGIKSSLKGKMPAFKGK